MRKGERKKEEQIRRRRLVVCWLLVCLLHASLSEDLFIQLYVLPH